MVVACFETMSAFGFGRAGKSPNCPSFDHLGEASIAWKNRSHCNAF